MLKTFLKLSKHVHTCPNLFKHNQICSNMSKHVCFVFSGVKMYDETCDRRFECRRLNILACIECSKLEFKLVLTSSNLLKHIQTYSNMSKLVCFHFQMSKCMTKTLAGELNVAHLIFPRNWVKFSTFSVIKLVL